MVRSPVDFTNPVFPILIDWKEDSAKIYFLWRRGALSPYLGIGRLCQNFLSPNPSATCWAFISLWNCLSSKYWLLKFLPHLEMKVQLWNKLPDIAKLIPESDHFQAMVENPPIRIVQMTWDLNKSVLPDIYWKWLSWLFISAPISPLPHQVWSLQLSCSLYQQKQTVALKASVYTLQVRVGWDGMALFLKFLLFPYVNPVERERGKLHSRGAGTESLLNILVSTSEETTDRAFFIQMAGGLAKDNAGAEGGKGRKWSRWGCVLK